MYNTKPLTHLIVYSLITLMLVGCGGAAVVPTVTPTIPPSPTPTIPPSPTPLSPKAILENAVAAMEELESYHFEMNIHMTTVSESTSVETPITFTGEFKAPDRFRGKLNFELAGLTIEMEVITIGEVVYIKDPSSDEWQMNTESTTPFTPEDFVGLEPDDIANMASLTLLGETVLNGVPVYQIEGMLSPDTIETVLGEAGGENKVVYWIDVEQGWIRQANVDMEFVEGDDESTEIRATVILTFSEFNKEIIIEAP